MVDGAVRMDEGADDGADDSADSCSGTDDAASRNTSDTTRSARAVGTCDADDGSGSRTDGCTNDGMTNPVSTDADAENVGAVDALVAALEADGDGGGRDERERAVVGPVGRVDDVNTFADVEGVEIFPGG